MPRERTLKSEDLATEVSRRLARTGDPRSEPPITERTLRYYRGLNLLSAPLRRERKKWIFEERHVLELMAVRRLQAAGWSLGKIGVALDAVREREGVLQALADPHRDAIPEELQREIEGLVSARDEAGYRGVLYARRQTGRESGPRPRSSEPSVVSVKLAPGVYLVVDRTQHARLEPRDAHRVGERAAAWLTGDSDESLHDDAERGGAA